jgi:hypothetical protein
MPVGQNLFRDILSWLAYRFCPLVLVISIVAMIVVALMLMEAPLLIVQHGLP